MRRTVGTVLGALALGITTVAAGPVQRHDTSLAVSPLVSELRSRPGTPDRIAVEIANNGDRAERIAISPLDWSTEADGTIALQRPGANGTHSLTGFISLGERQFPLAPHARRTVTLTVALPAGTPPGTSLWGGVIVKATDAAAPASSMGPASTVFLYDDVGEPRRHLTMETLRLVGRPNGSGVVLARVRNDGAAYARAGGHLTIAQAGHVLVDREVPVGAIFPGATRLLQTEVGGLRRGLTTVSLRLDYGGDVLLDGETSRTLP